ncbi:MAG: hypothetical protein H5T86_00975 [Armatimonadetes bacterium]|nr:hypothetical protein [Armatimonadota bacterium]
MFGRCPKCGSSEIEDGVCTACSFPASKVNQAMLRAYLVTGAMAMSVFVYAVIAIALTLQLENTVPLPRPVPYVLLLAAAAMVGFSAKTAASVAAQQTPSRMFSRLVLASALGETPAVIGLVLTIVSGDIRWMAIFTAISLLSFAIIGREMPAFARALTDYIDENPDAPV